MNEKNVRLKLENRIKKNGVRVSRILSVKFKKIKELNRKYYNITKVYNSTLEYIENISMLEEANEILKKDKNGEIIKIAYEQVLSSKKKVVLVIEKIKSIMCNSSGIIEIKDIVIEIRAGVGGEEASFFVDTLKNMYKKYSEKNSWEFKVLYVSKAKSYGYKEIAISICGREAYEKLKFESGVHRVQRVPKTETRGRVHTSTVTVAVIPMAKSLNFKIHEKDLRVETYKSGGSGGQHINTTDSAIRITHIPSSLVVTQSQKSQHQNKEQAIKMLRYKLVKQNIEKQNEKISVLRKLQIKNAGRAEKVRTYNYPQNRITDHRNNYTTYNLQLTIEEGIVEQFYSP